MNAQDLYKLLSNMTDEERESLDLYLKNDAHAGDGTYEVSNIRVSSVDEEDPEDRGCYYDKPVLLVT